jgi:DNA-binding CsgD family transcriptional regulator
MDNATLGRLIARIYDCAVDPSEWEPTLETIRDQLDGAYVSIHFLSFAATFPATPPEAVVFSTAWDEDWLDALMPLLGIVPGFDQFRDGEIDVPTSQLTAVDEATFRESEFYRRWVAPQGLRDRLGTNIIKRDTMTAMLSATSFASREPFGRREFGLVRLLTPHLRRALLIGDLLDERRLQLQLYRRLLDKLTVAVLLVEGEARLVYCNTAGDALLASSKCLTAIGGRLHVRAEARRAGFMAAVARACVADDAGLGCWGSGIPLPEPCQAGQVAVAYVLPFGRSERRRALGPGHAAIFVTTGETAQPPALEVLTALMGLTSSEARVALAIAEGRSTDATAASLGVSIHTLRKHLANIFDKTGLRGQVALGAFVNRLSLPVARPGGNPTETSALLK